MEGRFGVHSTVLQPCSPCPWRPHLPWCRRQRGTLFKAMCMRSPLVNKFVSSTKRVVVMWEPQAVPTSPSLSPLNVCSTVHHSLSHAPTFAACGCPGKEHLWTPWMQLATTAVSSVALQDDKALQCRGSHFTEVGMFPGTCWCLWAGKL